MTSPAKCARCGEPAREHHYNGACYEARLTIEPRLRYQSKM